MFLGLKELAVESKQGAVALALICSLTTRELPERAAGKDIWNGRLNYTANLAALLLELAMMERLIKGGTVVASNST